MALSTCRNEHRIEKGNLATMRRRCDLVVEPAGDYWSGWRLVARTVDMETLSGQGQLDDHPWRQAGDAERAARTCVDPNGLAFTLDLVCQRPDGEALVLEGGAHLHIHLLHHDGGSIELESPYMMLVLYTDIYDPDSPAGDNQMTAKVNGPRLSRFLRCIEQVGADFDELEQPFSHNAQRYGFAYTVDDDS
jgi:hypothetical protein